MRAGIVGVSCRRRPARMPWRSPAVRGKVQRHHAGQDSAGVWGSARGGRSCASERTPTRHLHQIGAQRPASTGTARSANNRPAIGPSTDMGLAAALVAKNDLPAQRRLGANLDTGLLGIASPVGGHESAATLRTGFRFANGDGAGTSGFAIHRVSPKLIAFLGQGVRRLAGIGNNAPRAMMIGNWRDCSACCSMNGSPARFLRLMLTG